VQPVRNGISIGRRFLSDAQAATATEYAVLLALVLLVAFAGIGLHGNWLFAKTGDINSALFG
jgi:Flp pilus assembly pilin Flp